MRNNKFDELQINISVVGLSGSENIKGIQGVGKSCLCNRLVQPNFFKSKHISIISSTEFYGSIFNQSHWIYWGSVNKEIRGKKYNFNFIEQTILIDDSSFREFITNTEPQDFIKRASMTELRIKKNAYICNQNSENDENASLNFEDKLQINLFLLVFDVSEVEKRNIRNQEVIFKQLFDAVVSNKKSIIVVTTKNDNLSSTVSDKFKSIVDKRPYSKYPIIETSSILDINIHPIYELAVHLCDSSFRNTRQPVPPTFAEALLARQKEDKQLMKEFSRTIQATLVNENLVLTWPEFIQSGEIGSFKSRFSENDLLSTFTAIQEDLLLERRGLNNRRFKEILLEILRKFDHLIPLEETSVDDVIGNLRSDSAFMSHFTEFSLRIECFKFDQAFSDCVPIPACLLDAQYEDNLLFVVDKYAQQKCLENKIYVHLLEHRDKYARKSVREIREDLTALINFFVPEDIIKHVYDKFQTHCLGILRRQFIEVIHENPNIFWSPNVVKLLEMISSHKQWTINGFNPIVTSNKTFNNDRKASDGLFMNKLVKDLNKLVVFDAVPIAHDERNLRIDWIREYFMFLSSKSEHECILRNISSDLCSTTLVQEILSSLSLARKIDDVVDTCHMFYLAVLGTDSNLTHFRDAIWSRRKDLPLKICKVHSLQYEVKLVLDLDLLKQTINNLAASPDKCSIVCVVFLIDKIDELESQVKDLEHFLSNQDPEILLTKYIISNIDYSAKSADLHDNELVELVDRNKYIFKHLLSENQNQTIDWIVSTTQKLVEQNFIWIVTVCGDTYDHAVIVKFLFESVKEFLLPFQSKTNDVTVLGSCNEIIIHNHRLVFVSYHQAIKLIIQSPSPPTVDAMIFVCSLDRLASINTCLAIKKHLPDVIASSCHFMFLCVGDEKSLHSELFQSESLKYGIEYGYYSNDSNEELKSKLFDFFKEICNNSGTIDSLHSATSNSSSLINTASKQGETLIKYLNRTMCQKCSDSYRSDISVYVNSSLTNGQNKCIFESGPYDEVLGEANANAFHVSSPEFVFDGAQDVGSQSTKVMCSLHSRLDIQSDPPVVFRTRIRSQSGPDLRSPIFADFTHNSFNFESSSFCSVCEQDLKKATMSLFNRQSFRMMRQSVTKETTQKTFTTKLHNLFNPLKKNSDPTIIDNRKWFTRSTSKRHKS